MSELVLNIVYEFANIFILINFIFSVLVFKKIKIENRFKLFQVYLFVSLVEVLFVDIIRFSRLSSFIVWLYPSIIFTTIHYAILSFFIFSDLRVKLFIHKLLISLFLFCLIIMNIIDIKHDSYYSATLSNFGMMLFSLFYYLDLIKNKNDESLEKNAVINVVNGVFFGAGIFMPILIFGKDLNRFLDVDTFNYLATLAPLGTIIMNIFFFKSILCIRQNTK